MVVSLGTRRRTIIIVVFSIYYFLILINCFFLCLATSSIPSINTETSVFGTKTTGLGSRKKTILSSSNPPSSLLKSLVSNKKSWYSIDSQKVLLKSLDYPQLWATLLFNKSDPARPVAIAFYQNVTQDGSHTFFHTANFTESFWGCISISAQRGKNTLVIHQIHNWTLPTTVTGVEGGLDDYSLPIEGIYGVYFLPSGPCVAVILESEAVYNSPSPASMTSHTSSSRIPPFLEIRRVIRMDIIPIPFATNEENVTEQDLDYFNFFSLKRQQRKEELRQINLLRKALRSHSLYYIPHRIVPNGRNSYRIGDITHTMQRSLVSSTLRTSSDPYLIATSSTAFGDNDPISKLLQPDARFFWNQELIRPLFDNLTTQRHYQTQSCNESQTSNHTNASACVENLLLDVSINIHSNITVNTTALFDQDNNTTFRNLSCTVSSLKNYTETSSITPCSAQQLLQRWILPCTSAFVGISRNVPLTIPSVPGSCSVNRTVDTNDTTKGGGQYYDEILISRRSRFRAGTRFTRRGADKTGSVANFAETEQICLIKEVDNNELDDTGRLKEVYSFVQTRGSIPLIWSSPANVREYAPRVQIATNPLDQARSLRAHLLEQILLYTPLLLPNKDHRSSTSSHEYRKRHPPMASDAKYMYKFKEVSTKIPEKVMFVNLVDKKKDQGRLGKAFDSVLQAIIDIHGEDDTVQTTDFSSFSENANDHSFTFDHNIVGNHTTTPTIPRGSVRHIWYDFHAECKGGKWNRLKTLLDMLYPGLDSHRYFSASPIIDNNMSLVSWNIASVQTGIVRTNCMDCLDRTNVVQSMFGRYVLFRQIQNRDAAGTDSKSSSSAPIRNAVGTRKVPLEWVVAYKSNTLQLPFIEGEKAHRMLWADNADAISRLYAGTPALKGDYTRTGRRTKRGALDDGMNSLTRYYINNFSDADRQEGIDLMTGAIPFSNTEDSVFGRAVNNELLRDTNYRNDDAELDHSTPSRKPNKMLNARHNLRRLLFGKYLQQVRMVTASPFALNEGNRWAPLEEWTSSKLPWWIALHDENDLLTFRSRKGTSKSKEIVQSAELIRQYQHALVAMVMLDLIDCYIPELITSFACVLCIAYLLA